MRNALSVDVEEWFQVGAFERTIDRADWDGLESRVADSTRVVLDLFDAAGVKSTFFTLGWVAERNPALIRDIVERGHEIASHGLDHARVFTLTPDQFRADLARARAAIEDAGVAVTGYRAPSFSIDTRTPWAHPILAEAGYIYSSSVAPLAHDHYGWPDAPRTAHRPLADSPLIELPVTTMPVLGKTVTTGGGFFRLLPSYFTDRAIDTLNADQRPAVFYFHPWEVDPGQPRVAGAPFKSRVRHYSRIGAMAGKLATLVRRHAWDRTDRVVDAARASPVTMPLLERPLAIRRANLSDAGERGRIAAFVERHPEGTPFHLAEWTLAVAEGCGQASRYLVAESAGGELVGVLPLTLVKSPLFGTALASAGFAVDGGALAEDEAGARTLLDSAWAIAESEKAASLELRGGAAPGGAFHTDTDSYLGFVIDLAASDDAQLTAIPRKQRAEVRKSFDKGLTITIGSDARHRGAHYAVYAESVRNLGTPVFPKKLFETHAARFGDRADILTVWHDDRAVASVLSLYFNGTVYPYWGGGTDDARALRANDAMYYALMNHARRRCCTRFDFGRSKVGTGAAAFKKNWGFEGVPLAYHVRTADGAAPRAINPLDPKYARRIALWKKLPLPVANILGPMISRGLG